MAHSVIDTSPEFRGKSQGGLYGDTIEWTFWQLSKDRLQTLEGRFRAGKTNLLSCSTTMEMGIDIGGLSVVAMNNAPRGPANWLQRAGRAGRRCHGTVPLSIVAE